MAGQGVEMIPGSCLPSMIFIYSWVTRSAPQDVYKRQDLSNILNRKFAEKIINQLSIIGIFIFILLSLKYVLRSYDLLYSQLGRVFGAGYTDINITLNLYRILAVGCAVAAVTFFIGSRKRNLKTALIVPALLIVISIIGKMCIRDSLRTEVERE